MFKEHRETKSLLNISRHSLKEAENKVEEMKAKLEEQKVINNDLKTKCSIYETTLYELKKMTNTQQFNSVVNLQNKIKSVLDKIHI